MFDFLCSPPVSVEVKGQIGNVPVTSCLSADDCLNLLKLPFNEHYTCIISIKLPNCSRIMLYAFMDQLFRKLCWHIRHISNALAITADATIKTIKQYYHILC